MSVDRDTIAPCSGSLLLVRLTVQVIADLLIVEALTPPISSGCLAAPSLPIILQKNGMVHVACDHVLIPFENKKHVLRFATSATQSKRYFTL